jgi:hypothetical protein
MSIRLPTQAVGQRIATLEEALENDGSVTRPILPREPPNGIWYVDLHVEAPGYGLPQVSAYRYQEWWQPSGGQWDLLAYVYDYRFGPGIAGVFGYHWHEMRGIDPSGTPDYHVKCVDPARPSLDPHFRGIRMDIWEARDEFTGLDASGKWPTCAGLRRLR